MIEWPIYIQMISDFNNMCRNDWIFYVWCLNVLFFLVNGVSVLVHLKSFLNNLYIELYVWVWIYRFVGHMYEFYQKWTKLLQKHISNFILNLMRFFSYEIADFILHVPFQIFVSFFHFWKLFGRIVGKFWMMFSSNQKSMDTKNLYKQAHTHVMTTMIMMTATSWQMITVFTSKIIVTSIAR